VETGKTTEIASALLSLKIPCNVVLAIDGPQVVRYRIVPQDYPYTSANTAPRKIKVSEIAARIDDLEIALGVRGIRLVKDGSLWLELPKDNPETVYFNKLKVSESATVPILLGVDENRSPVEIDLADSRTPHLLIAGATGSGKSVCVQSIIASIVKYRKPLAVGLAIADPKYELREWDVEHLIAPIVHEVEDIIEMLEYIAEEMDTRYRYSRTTECEQIVVVIDEYADLISLGGKDVEYLIARIAQKGRAAGIHIVLATQRPSVDIVTGAIKANFPARIAFAVASSVDSRVILDDTGAEKLGGMGDGLIRYGVKLVRFKGAFLEDPGKLIEQHKHGPWQIKEVAPAVEYPRIVTTARYRSPKSGQAEAAIGAAGGIVAGLAYVALAPFIGLGKGLKLWK
jgi:S-DNA-T family DNA segregation ATPase FtsK/SpoIIIE